MYKEITLDPKCMAEYHYYSLLKLGFGFEKGRYLSISVKEWVKQAFKEVKASNIPSVKQKSVKNHLNKMQRNIKDNSCIILSSYRKGRASSSINDWGKWQVEQSFIKPFSAVISESKLPESINYSNILEEHSDWYIPPTIQTGKSADEIFEIIKPIIPISRGLKIVDQYFKLAGNSVLHKIIAECEKHPSLKSIKLVTAIDTVNPTSVFKNEFETRYQNIPNFELIVAPLKYFHDRYVISNIGAIKSGQGFSEDIAKGTQSDKLSFHIASKIECDDVNNWIGKAIADGSAKLTILNNR